MGKNIGSGTLKLENLERVTRAFHRAQRKSQLSAGDVVVVRIGQSGQAAEVPPELGDANCAGLIVIKRPRDVLSRYLVHFLNSPDGRAQSLAETKGSTRQTLNTKSIAAAEVPLPPLAEQRRVADILDRGASLLSRRRLALTRLETVVSSIFVEMFGDPWTNPKGWPLGTLGEVATFVGGGTPRRAVQEYYTGSLCWATPKDIHGRFLDSTQEHVTETAVQNSATKLVPPGTILVVVKSKVLARRLPVVVTRVETCFGQDLKGILLDKRCTASYVASAMRINEEWLLRQARGINTEGLSLEHLRSFPLMLPPAAVQAKFARRLDRVEELTQKMAVSAAHLDDLVATLQHRAFGGEL